MQFFLSGERHLSDEFRSVSTWDPLPTTLLRYSASAAFSSLSTARKAWQSCSARGSVCFVPASFQSSTRRSHRPRYLRRPGPRKPSWGRCFGPLSTRTSWAGTLWILCLTASGTSRWVGRIDCSGTGYAWSLYEQGIRKNQYQVAQADFQVFSQ